MSLFSSVIYVVTVIVNVVYAFTSYEQSIRVNNFTPGIRIHLDLKLTRIEEGISTRLAVVISLPMLNHMIY